RPLADARLLAELRHRLTRRLARLDLPEDLDDLLRATSRLLHGCPSPDHPHSTWTRTRGSDQAGCRQRDKVPVVSAAPSLDLRLSVPRAALWLVALKPLVDVFFESGPSVTLDLGVAYTGLGLILFAFWLATKRR